MTQYHAGKHFTPEFLARPTCPIACCGRSITPTIDHRGPDFGRLGMEILANLHERSSSPAGRRTIYPASGTGAWEAALTNTLSPGDTVLMRHRHRLVRHAVE